MSRLVRAVSLTRMSPAPDVELSELHADKIVIPWENIQQTDNKPHNQPRALILFSFHCKDETEGSLLQFNRSCIQYRPNLFLLTVKLGICKKRYL